MGGRGKKLSICPPLVAGILVCVVSAKGGSADENDTGGFLLREPDPLGQGHRPSDLAEAIDRAEGCEAALTARLEGEEKALLLALVNIQNEVESSLALENFILGFRLGMRLAVEGLDRADGGLTGGEGR